MEVKVLVVLLVLLVLLIEGLEVVALDTQQMLVMRAALALSLSKYLTT
jgi:hypothetical protein